jgi:GAF domain-containing protein
MSEPGADEMLRELATLATGLVDAIAPPALADGPRAITAVAQRFFAAAACSIAEVDDEAEELVYIAASGAGADAVTGIRLPIGRGIAGWVAQSGQPIAVSDLTRDTRFARDIAESTSYIPTALLAVPIETPDRLLGVLSILDRDETRPGAARDLDMAALFADQAAVAMEASEAFTDAGRVLMTALADAAAGNTHLAATLAAAPTTSPHDPDLAEFAAVLAEFHRCGPEERALGLRLLRDVLAFVNRGGGGRSSPSR